MQYFMFPRLSYTLCSPVTNFSHITTFLTAERHGNERLLVKNWRCFFSLGGRVPHEEEESVGSKGISQECVVLNPLPMP